jgi:hypothetical protein
MKCHLFRTICIATLMLSVTAVASAQGHRGCTNKSLEGKWGYTETGTVMVPVMPPTTPPTYTPTLAVAVGLYTFDGHGSFSGVQVSSAGGKVSDDTKTGTYTVDPDCTGTFTVEIDSSSGLVRNSVWEFVLVDNATEIRAVMRSTEIVSGLPPSVPVPVSLLPVMAMTGTKVSPDRDDKK